MGEHLRAVGEHETKPEMGAEVLGFPEQLASPPDTDHYIDSNHHDKMKLRKRIAEGIREIDIFHVQGVAHQLMSQKAEGVQEVTGGFFRVISPEVIAQNPPDSIDDYPYLEPNAQTDAELDSALGLLDGFLGVSKQKLLDVFCDYARDHDLFERVREGQTVIVPSNHSVFQDQGYHLGLMHLAAREVSDFDRFDNHAVTVLGKTLGYLELPDTGNVIDDILRKAGGVLKTFPVSGGETLHDETLGSAVFTKEDMSIALRHYRKACNAHAREIFQRKVEDQKGSIIFMAATATPDERDERGDAWMSVFDDSTIKLMYDGMQAGAVVAPLFADYTSMVRSYARFSQRLYSKEDFREPNDVHQIGREIAALGQRERGANSDDKYFMRGNLYYPA